MPYHFFSRRYPSTHLTEVTDEDLRAGLRVLESILRHGFLLTPEGHPQGGARGFAAPRISFTEGTVQELSLRDVPVQGSLCCNHFEMFGPFAVHLDVEKAKSLRMNPVFYIDTGTAELRAFADRLLAGIRQIHNELITLSHLESKANPRHNWLEGYGWALPREQLGSPNVDYIQERQEYVNDAMLRIESLSLADARGFEEILSNGGLPFWQQAEITALLLDNMQDTDSSTESEKRTLARYRQREWRLIRTYSTDRFWVDLSPGDISYGGESPPAREFREAFLKYWGRNAQSDRGALLVAHEGKPICMAIDEIVCPSKCDSAVSRLLESLATCDYSLQIKISTYDIEDKFQRYK